MARRRRQEEEDNLELNLAPIMNMVMILIPLLLLMVQFDPKGLVEVLLSNNSPSSAPSDPSDEDEVEIPRLRVTITEEGFDIASHGSTPEGFRQYMYPVDGCAGSDMGADDEIENATICLDADASADADLIDRLDFTGLYNRLIDIRMDERWFEGFGEGDNDAVLINADREIPFEVIVRTMDTARNVLQRQGVALEPPQAGQADQYRIDPTLNDVQETALLESEYVMDGTLKVSLFPKVAFVVAASQ